MPKIRITERDLTGRVQGSAISNVVFVPVRFSKYNDGAAQVNKETAGIGVFSSLALFDSVKSFEDAAKAKVDTNEDGTLDEVTVIDTNSLGYRLCVHLLSIGYQVLVEALVDCSPVAVGDAAAGSKPSWDLIGDKSLYDVRFLTLGAMSEGAKYDASGAISADECFYVADQIAAMAQCAQTRGDCIALVNADESVPNFSYSVPETGDNDTESVRSKFRSASAYGEYAAGFTPWFYSTSDDLLGKTTDADGKTVKETSAKIPAAFGYLFAYANATKNSPEWYAIAGFERGIIPELSGVCHAYTSAEVEILQGRSVTTEVALDDSADNVGYAINPICYVRPAGNIIYGNRTLRVNDASKKLIASSFLNIRNGLSAIKKVMYEASRKYTFEQNTETLWINFQSYITPLLDRMQSGNGILGYTFIKQKTNAKARLQAKLTLIPVEAVEDFDLYVELADDLKVSE